MVVIQLNKPLPLLNTFYFVKYFEFDAARFTLFKQNSPVSYNNVHWCSLALLIMTLFLS